MLTQARLKELFAYDPSTGLFTRLVGPGKRPDLKGKVAGHFHNQGYVIICVDRRKYRAHHLAWLYVHGYLPAQLDHKNLDKADNRIDNLRPATKAQNEMNKPPRCNNTSGATGVYWSRCAQKWQAHIKLNGVIRYLGIYADKAEAIAARRAAELKLFGEFAVIPQFAYGVDSPRAAD